MYVCVCVCVCVCLCAHSLSLFLSAPACWPFKDVEDPFSGRIQDMEVVNCWHLFFVIPRCSVLFEASPFLVFVKLKSVLLGSSFPAFLACRVGPACLGLASADLSRLSVVVDTCSGPNEGQQGPCLGADPFSLQSRPVNTKVFSFVPQTLEGRGDSQWTLTEWEATRHLGIIYELRV